MATSPVSEQGHFAAAPQTKGAMPDPSARAGTWRKMGALADQAIVSATSFLVTIVLARAVAADEFGLYILGQSMLIFLMNVQGALISTPYTLFGPQLESQARAEYTGSSLAHQVLLSLLGAIALIGVAIVAGLVAPASARFASLMATLAIVSVFVLLKEYARRLCFAWFHMGAAVALDAAVALLQLGLLVALWWKGGLSACAAYWAIGLACALAALVYLVAERGSFVLRRCQIVADWRRNWATAKWLAAGNVANTASNQAYPWLLSGFQSAAITGAYGACLGPLLLANPFLLGVANYLAPSSAHAMARGGVSDLARTVRANTLLILAGMGAFCLACVAFGGWIVVALYGSAYAGLGWIVALLAVGQWAASATLAMQYGLLTIGRADVGVKSYLVGLAFTATAGLWLIHAFGLPGAAVSFLLSSTFGSAYRLLVYTREVANKGASFKKNAGEPAIAPTCPLCGAEGTPTYTGLEDRLFGAPGTWSFHTCTRAGCRLLWLDSPPDEARAAEAYAQYYTHDEPPPSPPPPPTGPFRAHWARRYGYASAATRGHDELGNLLLAWNPYRRAQANMRVRFLPATPQGRLLDIGCGNGEWLQFMQGLGWRVTGVETDPEAARCASARGLRIFEGPLDAHKFPACSFEAITLHHVIEHLRDPRAVLAECYRILAPGGRLVVATPNAEAMGHRLLGQAWRGLEPPRHVGVMNARLLDRLLSEAGFEAIAVRTVITSRYMLEESLRLARWVESRALRALCARLLVTAEWAGCAFGLRIGEVLVAQAVRSDQHDHE